MHITTTAKAAAAVIAALIALPATAQKNVAYQDAHVRISLVTDGMARMEYSPDGRFEDGQSLMAINRDYPAVDYTTRDRGKTVEITTRSMVIKYTKSQGPLGDGNLLITSPKRKGVKPFAWRPGQKDPLNLKGTYRTLDGYDGNMHGDQPMPIEDGLLSRSGWTFIDDSQNYLFDHSDWQWVSHRREEGKAQDWYFMAYGHDYRKALRDFTVVSGKMALPPRYAFGYWWSRYWCYTDNELRQLVDNFDTYSIPLDVLVVDMDWHYTEKGKGAWTGYTWNRRLFPDPKGFLQWAGSKQLNVTINLHPADGIKPYEEQYPAMARWMGMNPDEKKDIDWAASDKRFMEGWYNTVLHPMECDGVSFWWLDWQQGLNDKEFPRLGNTWWINYTTFTDMERHRKERPMLYHRWGGLGNHRYQIGFSGDAVISWKSLDFQPYFNATASNVLYGYWSHDIGGHMNANRIDPELYIRWLQFGALSPILRTHSTKSSVLDKEPWVFDHQHFSIIRNTILERYRMAPYIYTMARRAYDEGLSLCRPLYYEWPENEEAYQERNSYMFGDQILVSPITQPMADGVSRHKVWLPGGNDWYEVATGTLLKGGQRVERNFHLDEYPMYVKAGAVIPMYDKVKNLKSNDEPIVVTVYPGGNGEFSMYEDNGNDKAYATAFARTRMTQENEGNKLTVRIGRREGSYEGMPETRKYSVKIVARAVPEQVVVNGKPAAFDYDGNTLTATIAIADSDPNIEKTVEVTYAPDAIDLADGLMGQMRRIGQNNYRLKRQKAGIVFGEELGTMESTGRAISYYPDRMNELVAAFRANYQRLPQLLDANGVTEKQREIYLRATY